MPYYDEQGNEVAGLLTEEELNAKLEEERTALNERLEAEKATAQERITALEAERIAAQQAVDAAKKNGESGGEGGDKDVNFANLRKKLDETTEALEAEKKANETRYSAIQADKINAEIAAIAGDDVELAKKIRYNFDNVLTGMKASTAEEIRQKALAAQRLSSTTEEGPDALNVALSGPNKGVHVQQNQNKNFTPNEVAIGARLGITDQDRARYINDPRLK